VTPPGFIIRRAQTLEAHDVAALAGRTFVAAYGASNTPADVALHLSQHCSTAYFERRLADPLTTGVHPPARQLVRFYLEQSWIGRGVSGPLMVAAIEEARSRGAEALWLTVWEAAPRPIAFYLKCGFRSAGTIPFRIGTDVQRDLLMVRDLRVPV
jgi:GNAT superfamily N-acetyltransferase